MFGADPLSQNFLDETVEDNVSRCAHPRPQARPDPRVQPKPKAKPKPSTRKDVAKPRWRWPPPPAPQAEPES